MNHPFTPSQANSLYCATCKKDELAHGSEAVCECCPNVGPVEIMYGNILMCQSCQDKEIQAAKDRNDPIIQKLRVEESNKRIELARLSQSQNIDNSITVRTDLFNAATVSILELKQSIDNDETITNKPYILAEILSQRFNHFKKLIFDSQQVIVEATNNQKAIQVYLNNLANQLRAEERERLKISDINYQPKPPKSSQPRVIKTKKVKFNKAELNEIAIKAGVSSSTLQMIAVAKNCSLAEAAEIIKKSVETGRTQSTS